MKIGHDVSSSTVELINGLVSLVHQATMPDVAQEAMEALLALHAPDKIEVWNPEAPVNTFWDLSSQVMYSISQKLVQHQIANYSDVLKWLKEILICRNTFLQRHKDYANVGTHVQICYNAHNKLVVVLFTYLWSVDLEAVITALSCFGLLCEEADIRSGPDESPFSLMPNYPSYQDLAQVASTVKASNPTSREDSKFSFYEQTQGRYLLQKKIMALLRNVQYWDEGVQSAWEETFRNWEATSKILQSYPKGKSEDGQEIFHRAIGKRRASHQSSEHDLEEQINEWANMTWFLLSLGGVCLLKRRPPKNSSQSEDSLRHQQSSMSSLTASLSSGRGSMHPSTTSLATLNASPQEVQYCPVTQFISQLLRLLVCSNEKFGPQIQKHVKTLVGEEMAPDLYPLLFDQIRGIVDKFFDQQGQVRPVRVTKYNEKIFHY